MMVMQVTHSNFTIMMKLSFTILLITSLPSTVSSSGCTIKGFEIDLKSGARTALQEQFSSRRSAQELYNNYAVCHDNWGDNIKAIAQDEEACKGTAFEFKLKNLVDDTIIEEAASDTAPYLLDSTTQDGLLNGKVLPVGKYQLTIHPLQQILGTTKTNTIRKSLATSLSRKINFEVINCLNFQPNNECNKCTAEQTCEGSMCVSKGYLRFTLVYTGDDVWDMAMKVTPPTSDTVIGAYSKSLSVPDGVVSNDVATGGHADEDYKYSSCRSIGQWVKNIIYPSIDQTPKGTYTIELEDVEDLNCQGIVNTPTPKQYELKIYQNEVLIKTYTNADGKIFTFEI